MLETLVPRGFRNLEPVPVEFAEGITVFHGENGAGKTNVLEALCVASGRPSFRGAEPAQMAGSPEGFAVRAAIARAAPPEELLVTWSPGQPRRFFRGGRRTDFSDAGRLLPAVFLAPEDRALFTGAPGGRRRFLDRLALGLQPGSAEDFARFARVLAQRNAALSSLPAARPALAAWTEEFIGCAAAVRARREAAFGAWSAELFELARRTERLAGLRPVYEAGAVLGGEAAEHYRSRAAALAAAEERRGHTLFGPQREEMEFFRDGRPFAASASSGEILKAAFLARLAEGRALAREGAEPLYAVDDFDADLSPRASEELLSLLPGNAQWILTTARESAVGICPRRPERIYEVAHGRLSPRAGRPTLKAVG